VKIIEGGRGRKWRRENKKNSEKEKNMYKIKTKSIENEKEMGRQE
jgi:hypothetical protein